MANPGYVKQKLPIKGEIGPCSPYLDYKDEFYRN